MKLAQATRMMPFSFLKGARSPREGEAPNITIIAATAETPAATGIRKHDTPTHFVVVRDIDGCNSIRRIRIQRDVGIACCKTGQSQHDSL